MSVPLGAPHHAGTNASFWTDRPTLVTGATGLVGGWLTESLLQRRAAVVCLVRDRVPHSRLIAEGLAERVTLVRGDLRDQALLERVLGEYEIDTVFHLAAQTIVGVANRNPVSTFESNVGGTWALLEACRRSPGVKQVVVASSDKAYGDHASTVYDESMPLQGRHPYDVSKACADLIAQGYAATYGLPVAITRCGNFFGGGDLNWSRLVPGTIRSIHHGQRPVIRSDGQYVRDYFYVEDGAAAYLTLAEQLAARPELRGEAFNFSYGAQHTVLELVGRIGTIMATTLTPDVQNVATGEIRIQRLSAQKARDVLGWQPTLTLDEGLRRTVAWYREHFHRADERR
ncbi:MAG: GDP-mannose 4,6-dehydratase [Chloroflexota bacterium]